MKKELQKVVKGTYMPAGESDCEPKAPCLIPRRKIKSRKWAHNFVVGGIKRLQRVVWFLCEPKHRTRFHTDSCIGCPAIHYLRWPATSTHHAIRIRFCMSVCCPWLERTKRSEAWFEIYIVDQEPGATGILRLCELQSVCFLILGLGGGDGARVLGLGRIQNVYPPSCSKGSRADRKPWCIKVIVIANAEDCEPADACLK